MTVKILVVAMLLAPLLTAQDGEWVLAVSSLTYRVSTPLPISQGASHAARGKGFCQSAQCSFEVSVAMKSFASGDPRFDLLMMQTFRGAYFPLAKVRMMLPSADLTASSFRCAVEIEFAGQKLTYRDVAFQTSPSLMGPRVIGTIPAKLSDFKIDLPSLPIPARNELPIVVDMTWRPGP